MTDLELFIISRWMYSIGEEIITNYQYTDLLNEIIEKYPDSPYVHRSWSSDPCPVELLRKYGYDSHAYEVILTDKTESIPSINDWLSLQSVYGNLNERVCVSYKHDGWNIQASYYNGALLQIQSRGRANDPINAAVLASKIPQTIPAMGKVTICFEATVSNENYATVKAECGNKSQRGAVSTCMAKSAYVQYVDMHAHSIVGDVQYGDPLPLLEEWGFQVVGYRYASTYQELIDVLEILSEEERSYNSPTDGIVVRGTVTRAVRLLCWEEPLYHSYVVDYDETQGMHRFGIKVVIKPILLKNSTQSRVSCTNYQRIIDNNLRKGFPIVFRLSSMAIADLDVEGTRRLQETWKGREDEYVKHIDEIEEAKRIAIDSGIKYFKPEYGQP